MLAQRPFLLSFSILALPLWSDSARGFSIDSVTVVPSAAIAPNDPVSLEVLITTPSGPASLYQLTKVSVTGNQVLVEIFPTAGPLDALDSLVETVALGTFQAGSYDYTVVITPEFDAAWGTREVTGCFGVTQTCCISSTQPEADTNGSKNRFLTFSAGDPDRMQAIRITFVDLPSPFANWNGAELWVGPIGLVSDNGSVVAPIPGFPHFKAASLQCSPHYEIWNSLGIVNVFHEGIIPLGSYEIQVIDLTCDPGDGVSYSDPLDLTTARWGDTVGNPLTIPPGAPDGALDIIDVLAVLRRFASVPGSISKTQADLEPGCLDLVNNITDALASVAGFQGLLYPFEPTTTDPCDSTCVIPLP